MQSKKSSKTDNVTRITDRNGKITQLAYDGLGRLTQVSDPVPCPPSATAFDSARGWIFRKIGRLPEAFQGGRRLKSA